MPLYFSPRDQQNTNIQGNQHITLKNIGLRHNFNVMPIFLEQRAQQQQMMWHGGYHSFSSGTVRQNSGTRLCTIGFYARAALHITFRLSFSTCPTLSKIGNRKCTITFSANFRSSCSSYIPAQPIIHSLHVPAIITSTESTAMRSTLHRYTLELQSRLRITHRSESTICRRTPTAEPPLSQQPLKKRCFPGAAPSCTEEESRSVPPQLSPARTSTVCTL